jgi:hypothetical protein
MFFPAYARWRSAQRLVLMVMLCALVVPFLSAQAAGAQDATPTPETDSGPRFIIRPVDGADGDYFTVKADAGTTQRLTVVLGNADDEALKLRTFVNDAVPMTNGGFSIADEAVPATGTATWIDYPAETYTFQSGEGVERSFDVTVPADAKPGQYIAGLALQTADPLEVEGTSMFNQIIRKTIAVFIIVPGPEQPAYELGTPELKTDSVIPRIEIPITNTGNVLVKPAGELTLTDASGETVLTAPIAMGSVYAGTTAPLSVGLTTALPDGDYQLSVSLKDDATGVTASLENQTITVSAAAAQPSPLTMTADVSVSPDANNPAFATVDVQIDNQGDPVAQAEVLLDVMRDGELVETFSLASSLALPPGATTVNQRYIPPAGWESGSWSFVLRLNVVDQTTGAATTVTTLDDLPAIEIGK